MAGEFKIKNGAIINGSITGITEADGDNSTKVASTSWVRTRLLNAGYLTGSGTTSFLARFNSSNTLTNSLIYDNGTQVGIGDRVSLNLSKVERTLNLLGTNSVMRIGRFTDSPSTSSPSIELISYSDDGSVRRFFWDYFVNGDDSFIIRQRIAGGGVSTTGVVVDNLRFSIKSGGQLQFNNYVSTTSFVGTVAGYLAFDSSGNIITTAAPTGSSTGETAVRSSQTFTATAGQTIFTISGGYTPGLIDVYLNGIYINGSAITATDGITIVLSEVALLNDVLDVVIFSATTSVGGSSSYVLSTRTITINGTSQDLSTNAIFSVGTVTSVSEITLSTSGTDLSSTVANTNTTPVITLNVPTASAINRGALSSTDWSTFYSKQAALSGTGIVKSTAGVISYLTDPLPIANGGTGSETKNFVDLTTAQTIAGDKTLINNFVIASEGLTGFPLTIGKINNGGRISFIRGSDGVATAYFGHTDSTTTGVMTLYGTSNVVIQSAGSTTTTQIRASGNDAGVQLIASGTRGRITFQNAGNITGYIYNTGNWVIQTGGSFTDAGYKLDVTGTARFTSDILINGATAGLGGGSITTNIAFGASALSSNTAGVYNVAIGGLALQNNTGSYNIAAGGQALINNTSGNYNMSIGAFTMTSNTTGQYNVALGGFALRVNNGNYNVAIGYQALNSNTAFSNNVAVGMTALRTLSSGAFNIGIGSDAGTFITGGITSNSTSNNSIFIGHNTRSLSSGQTNQIIIGHASTGFGSNTTVLGNASTIFTVIYGNVLIGTTTNAGYKLDVNGTGRFSGKLITTGIANDWGLVVNGSSTLGQSYGLNIIAGSNSSDVSFLVANFVGSDLLRITGTGAATFSNTVSLKGALTIVRSNTAESSVINNEGNLNYNARDSFNHVFQSNGTEIARISSTGVPTFLSLTGTGDRIVISNSSGLLSSATIGSGLSYSGGILTATGGGGGSSVDELQVALLSQVFG